MGLNKEKYVNTSIHPIQTLNQNILLVLLLSLSDISQWTETCQGPEAPDSRGELLVTRIYVK